MSRECVYATLAILFISTACNDPSNQSKVNPDATRELKMYVAENFGMEGYETSWYHLIRDIEVKGRIAFVYATFESSSAATSLCMAASAYAFSNENRHWGIDTVRVIGSTGNVLRSRDGLRESCDDETVP